MTSPNTWIDSSESLGAGILRLEPRVVISEYEAETGKELADDIKSSIGFLVKWINGLQASITADWLQFLQLFLTSNTIYDRGVTQPIIDALEKLRAPRKSTPSDEVITTVESLLEYGMRSPI